MASGSSSLPALVLERGIERHPVDQDILPPPPIDLIRGDRPVVPMPSSSHQSDALTHHTDRRDEDISIGQSAASLEHGGSGTLPVQGGDENVLTVENLAQWLEVPRDEKAGEQSKECLLKCLNLEVKLAVAHARGKMSIGMGVAGSEGVWARMNLASSHGTKKLVRVLEELDGEDSEITEQMDAELVTSSGSDHCTTGDQS